MGIGTTLAWTLSSRMTLGQVSLPLWILLFCRLLTFAAVQWDVAWHRSLGRDTFWSPPHLLIYSALGLVTVTACWVFIRDGWRTTRGYFVVALGGLVVYLAAPFDELWHRWYGLDVDIWSPPHLTGVAGGFIVAVGSVYALASELRQLGRLDRTDHLQSLRRASAADWLLIVFIALLVTSPLFAMGRYTIVAWTRDAIFYPILGGLSVPVICVANLRTTGRRWTATLTVASYMGLMMLMAGIVVMMGLKPVSLPPLLLLPALCIDLFYLSRRRTDGFGAALATGTLFALVFYWTEYWWKLWLIGYSWPSERILLGFPLTLVAGALGGGLGYALGNSFRGTSRSKEGEHHVPSARSAPRRREPYSP